MAWIFSLSAECGACQDAAKTFAAHFHGLTISLADGSNFPCQTATFHDGECWWAWAVPQGTSVRGIRDEQDEREMSEIGFALYERLRSAPPFRFAIVGVEVDGFLSFKELSDHVINGDFDGLVIADSVWRQLGSPHVFSPFSLGYRWRPFILAK